MKIIEISTRSRATLLVGLLSFHSLSSCVNTGQALGMTKDRQEIAIKMETRQKLLGENNASQPSEQNASNASNNHTSLLEEHESGKCAGSPDCPHCYSSQWKWLWSTEKGQKILKWILLSESFLGTFGLVGAVVTGIDLWNKGSYSLPGSTPMNETFFIGNATTALTTIAPESMANTTGFLTTLFPVLASAGAGAIAPLSNLVRNGASSFVPNKYDPTTEVYPAESIQEEVKKLALQQFDSNYNSADYNVLKAFRGKKTSSNQELNNNRSEASNSVTGHRVVDPRVLPYLDELPFRDRKRGIEYLTKKGFITDNTRDKNGRSILLSYVPQYLRNSLFSGVDYLQSERQKFNGNGAMASKVTAKAVNKASQSRGEEAAATDVDRSTQEKAKKRAKNGTVEDAIITPEGQNLDEYEERLNKALKKFSNKKFSK